MQIMQKQIVKTPTTYLLQNLLWITLIYSLCGVAQIVVKNSMLWLVSCVNYFPPAFLQVIITKNCPGMGGGLWDRGGTDNHQITCSAQGGAEVSVRLLMTKNPACSFSCPLPCTRNLVWTVPAAGLGRGGLNVNTHISLVIFKPTYEAWNCVKLGPVTDTRVLRAHAQTILPQRIS